MVGEVTDALIGIVEAMFRAAAGLICDESALELHEMEKMARAEPEAELMPMFDMIKESILATNSKVEALSDTVQTLATALSALMSNTTTERKTVGMSQSRGSLSMTQIAGLPSQVFPNNVKSKGARRIDSLHEQKALEMGSSKALMRITGFEKGASLLHANVDADDVNDFNMLYARGVPPNQKFERLAALPNR